MNRVIISPDLAQTQPENFTLVLQDMNRKTEAGHWKLDWLFHQGSDRCCFIRWLAAVMWMCVFRKKNKQVLNYNSGINRLFLEVNVSNTPSQGRQAEDAHDAILNISIPPSLIYSGIRTKAVKVKVLVIQTLSHRPRPQSVVVDLPLMWCVPVNKSHTLVGKLQKTCVLQQSPSSVKVKQNRLCLTWTLFVFQADVSAAECSVHHTVLQCELGNPFTSNHKVNYALLLLPVLLSVVLSILLSVVSVLLVLSVILSVVLSLLSLMLSVVVCEVMRVTLSVVLCVVVRVVLSVVPCVVLCKVVWCTVCFLCSTVCSIFCRTIYTVCSAVLLSVELSVVLFVRLSVVLSVLFVVTCL